MGLSLDALCRCKPIIPFDESGLDAFFEVECSHRLGVLLGASCSWSRFEHVREVLELIAPTAYEGTILSTMDPPRRLTLLTPDGAARLAAEMRVLQAACAERLVPGVILDGDPLLAEDAALVLRDGALTIAAGDDFVVQVVKGGELVVELPDLALRFSGRVVEFTDEGIACGERLVPGVVLEPSRRPFDRAEAVQLNFARVIPSLMSDLSEVAGVAARDGQALRME